MDETENNDYICELSTLLSTKETSKIVPRNYNYSKYLREISSNHLQLVLDHNNAAPQVNEPWGIDYILL